MAPFHIVTHIYDANTGNKFCRGGVCVSRRQNTNHSFAEFYYYQTKKLLYCFIIKKEYSYLKNSILLLNTKC